MKSYEELQAERDALAVQLGEARQQHAATLNRLYEIFNIDDSDGEVRAKWALLSASNCKAERDALAATVGALKKIREDWKGLAINDAKTLIAFIEAADKTPQQHLAEIRAEAIEQAATYLSESIPDKHHESVIFKDRYAYISTRYLREYADKVRRGEVE